MTACGHQLDESDAQAICVLRAPHSTHTDGVRHTWTENHYTTEYVPAEDLASRGVDPGTNSAHFLLLNDTFLSDAPDGEG